jgi:phosphatidylserine/phosphatidylglycerophosphate/cardiolipin synthase-like enzyme
MLVATTPVGAGQVANVCFTPGQNCEAIVVNEINQARQEVLVQAYSFTSRPIGSALVVAKQRGVDVRLIADRSEYESFAGETQWVAQHGVPVLIDAPPGNHAIAHNMVLVIDGHRVLTGSYNFTKAAATVNVENLMVVEGQDVATAYRNNWISRSRASTTLNMTN